MTLHSRTSVKTIILCLLLLGMSLLSVIPTVGANPDTLVLLHPHSADVADDVINDFKEWYSEEYGVSISVTQLTMDSGACYQQVTTWNGEPEADVMWGGGEYYFMSLAEKGLLEGYTVSGDDDIEDVFGGWPLKDPEGQSRWYAAALSTFGIMWNNDYLEAHGVTAPQTWEDLTNPEYYGHIVMCDPAKSGSTTFITIMVTEHFIVEEGWGQNATGWQNAWKYWAKLASNVGLFTESSSAVPDKVAIGEYGIGIVIDYYAWEQFKAGVNVGFNNGGATSISADPAGILKGAPHLTEAQRWMEYLIGKRGQEAVGRHRMPMRADAAPTSPVLSAWYNATDVPVIPDYSRDMHNAMFSLTREMFSYWLVTNHNVVKAARDKMIECEALGIQSYEDYQSAVEQYNMVPESSDTLVKGLAVDRKVEAANWETWGATHFEAAKTAAQNAIDEYEQNLQEEQEREQQAARNRMYTYVGGGIAVVVIIGLLYYYTKRT